MCDARLLLRSKEGMVPRILDVSSGESGLHRGDRGASGPAPLGPRQPPSEQSRCKPRSFLPLALFVPSSVPAHVHGRRRARGESLAASTSRCREAHVLGLACSSATYAIF